MRLVQAVWGHRFRIVRSWSVYFRGEVLHNVDRLPVYHEVRGSTIATVVQNLDFCFLPGNIEAQVYSLALIRLECVAQIIGIIADQGNVIYKGPCWRTSICQWWSLCLWMLYQGSSQWHGRRGKEPRCNPVLHLILWGSIQMCSFLSVPWQRYWCEDP